MEETLLSVALGLGLAAACGFRIFVPLLVMSIAVRSGHLAVTSGFDWIGGDAALIAFSVATLIEIAAYFVPWVDNLLDGIATPTAVIAGVLASASVFTDMSPILRWSVAAFGGGTAALGVQAVTVAGRQLSSVTTLGLGNSVVALLEAMSSAALAVVAVLLPFVAAILLVVLAVVAAKWLLFRQAPPRGAAGRAGSAHP